MTDNLFGYGCWRVGGNAGHGVAGSFGKVMQY